MNDIRETGRGMKIALILTLLGIAGACLTWDHFARGPAPRPSEPAGADQRMVFVNGGVAPSPFVPSAGPGRRPRVRPVEPEPRPEPPRPSPEKEQFVVRKGDTLSDIAVEVYGTARGWPEIARANDLEPPYRIVPGRVLEIP